MIKVKYRPDRHELTIKGHAGAGEHGHDVICAAASMVFYNLCQMLRQYDQDKAFARKPEMQDEPGNAKIKVTPATGYEAWIDHDFLYALTGFQLLAGNHPEYVDLVVMEH